MALSQARGGVYQRLSKRRRGSGRARAVLRLLQSPAVAPIPGVPAASGGVLAKLMLNASDSIRLIYQPFSTLILPENGLDTGEHHRPHNGKILRSRLRYWVNLASSKLMVLAPCVISGAGTWGLRSSSVMHIG